MRKFIASIAAGSALLLSITPAIAKGPSQPAGQSNKAHLYLYEKDPSDWSIVDQGAWGKLTYDLSGDMFNYVFNGHQMVAGGDYTLIYYPDPWPGEGLICLGSGVADELGNVHIKNAISTGDLTDAKIWLVKSADVSCESTTWNVLGTYEWVVLNTYHHDIFIQTQNPDGTFSGYGCYPAGDTTCVGHETITGKVEGDTFTMTTVYDGTYNTGYTATAIGTISPDGTIEGSSPWTWEMSLETAKKVDPKMIGWNPMEYLFEEVLISFDQTQ